MHAGVPPEDIWWEAGGLFGAAHAGDAPPLALPRQVAGLIETVLCHRDPERHALLYTLIWRVRHGERALCEVASDPLVRRLESMAKAVRGDIHRMHAFLRFREVRDPDGGERYLAWFEPGHFILDAAAPFFVARFASLVWSILTPIGSLHWDRAALAAGPPGRRADVPASDALEPAWRGYYENVFNPARVNPAAMRAHMPRRYWRDMPETQGIAELVRGAGAQMQDMIAREAAAPVKRDPLKAVAAMAPREPASLAELNRMLAMLAPLTPGADRAVPGEGPEGAAIAFVGEQPGDQEDREGRPFVGPAGQVFDGVLRAAGIDRARVYVTNAGVTP